MLPLKEFRRLDLNSEELGVPVRELMGNAGRALAEQAERMTPDGRIVFLCGKGNNGGDGYAACVELQARGRDAVCVAMEPPSGEESKHWASRCDGTVSWPDFDRQDPALAVDCLLGSGIVGDPRPPYDAAIAWLNHPSPVLACDIPSPGVRADATVTFHAAKGDMGNAGDVIVVDIGIPKAAETDIGFGDLAVGYPRSAASSHKGENGVVLVVAGGPYTGAPYYASVGAYRAGADLVPVFCPHDAAVAVRGYGPEPIVHDANPGAHLNLEGAAAATEFLPKATALLIGPGLGNHPDTVAAVKQILDAAADAGVTTVIDADGLDGIPDGYWARNGARTVITPHRQEFQDLAGSDSAKAFAARTGCTVLLKGAVDTVASPERTKVCRRGHPAMTVGGTGDVLAGAVAAVMSRGASPSDAAAAGIYLVNVAGEAAAAELGDGLVALDVADHLPEILARLG